MKLVQLSNKIARPFDPLLRGLKRPVLIMLKSREIDKRATMVAIQYSAHT